MPNAELAFADPNIVLSVRSFALEDGLSRLFAVRVTAAARVDLSLDAIAGHPAAFRLATGDPAQPFAVWSGLCADVELTEVEPSGVSRYALAIVPELWRCTQRRNSRIFQHQSAVDIAVALLGEWGMEPVVRLEPEAFPIHEYRVQLDESDFAFLSRTLEHAGISYFFEQAHPRGAEKNDDRELSSMHLVLTDRPAVTGPRHAAPVRYAGNASDESNTPCIRRVRLGRSVRPGRASLAGYDYRSSPDLRLYAEARASVASELAYERFVYAPEVFLEEPRGNARSSPCGAAVREELGAEAAALELERARTGQRAVSFATNVLPLAPGVVFQLDEHPRADLSEPLLVTARRLSGEIDEVWRVEAEASFAADPWRPACVTPKPRVMGVQSAMVVGPPGEEIFTDELGRVKVQFHWDRYGARDETSSCWIRVNQIWAGAGYGVSHVPRVGSEVIVDFFDGDPDLPVVVGRAHNRGAMPPDRLPHDKTKSTWRSASTPGGDGYNEISMCDASGGELLFLRAQRDMKRQVLADDESSIGGDQTILVQGDAALSVGGDEWLTVGGDHHLSVAGQSITTAETGITSQAGARTGVSFESGRLIISNGQASIVLDGPNLYIDAEANLRVRTGKLLSLFGDAVEVDGNSSNVAIDSDTFAPPVLMQLDGTSASPAVPTLSEGEASPSFYSASLVPEAPSGIEEAEFDGYHFLKELAAEKGLKLPKKLYFKPEVNEQIHRLGRIAYRGRKVRAKILDRETYRAMRKRLEDRIEAEKQRIKDFGRDVHQIFEKQRDHVGEVATGLRERLEVERATLAATREELGAIFRGERGDLLDSAKALIHVAREQGASLKQLRDDVKAMVDRELETFQKFKAEWKGVYDEVTGYVADVKALIDDPKDAIMNIVFGEHKELANDITALADDLGYGEKVADFFGIESPEAAQEASKIGDLESLKEMEAAAEASEGPPAYDPSEMQQYSGESGWTPPEQGGLPKNGANALSPKKGLGPIDGSSSRGGMSPKGGLSPRAGGPSPRSGLGGAGRLSGPGSSPRLGGGGADATRLGGAPSLGSSAPGGVSSGSAGAAIAPAQRGADVRGTAGARGAALSQRGPEFAAPRPTAGSNAESAGQSPTSRPGATDEAGAQRVAGATTEGADGAPTADGSRLFGHAVDGAEADAVSQPGALSAGDVAASVSEETALLLQSPGDGQILVMPAAGAARVDPQAVSAAMVEAQMEGTPASTGIAEALAERGYAVYTRPWGDWQGPFVQVASPA
jgi:type VI secretion system secreted protein VgrG